MGVSIHWIASVARIPAVMAYSARSNRSSASLVGLQQFQIQLSSSRATVGIAMRNPMRMDPDQKLPSGPKMHKTSTSAVRRFRAPNPGSRSFAMLHPSSMRNRPPSKPNRRSIDIECHSIPSLWQSDFARAFTHGRDKLNRLPRRIRTSPPALRSTCLPPARSTRPAAGRTATKPL